MRPSITITVCLVCIHFGSVFSNSQSNSSHRDENESWKPLHNAIKAGNEIEVQRLLKNGANPNATDENGNSALILAAEKVSENIIRLLIENGAYVNAVGQGGKTALINAAINSNSYGEEKIVQLLIDKGANINAADENNNTALIHVVNLGFEPAVQVLIEKGADINVTNENGNSALLLAATKGPESMIKLLIENEADVNTRGNEGKTPLINAAYNGFETTVQALIERGANINNTDDAGNSPLLVACETGPESMIKLLIENGADINIRNKVNNTPVLQALAQGFNRIAELLIQKGVDVDVIGSGNGYTDNTALIDAAWQGYEEIVRMLLEKGVRVNILDIEKKSALFYATEGGFDIIVQLLIEHGANVDLRDKEGNTPLIVAVKNGYKEVVEVLVHQLLIENGANIDVRDKEGNTPLILAAKNGFKEIVEVLLHSHAKVNVINKIGQSALDAASSLSATQGVEEIKRLLTTHGAELGSKLLYRITAQKACRMYSNQTARWSNLGIGSRITDGILAEIGEFPWMVALGYLSGRYKVSFSCGGSLISDKFVLTAAHCVKDVRRPVVARLGKITLTDEDDFRAENQNIREIILHPKYSLSKKKNDIALIRLVDCLWITKFIQPVCIQTDLRDEGTHADLIVTGWGQTQLRVASTNLLKIDLKTMPLSECNTTFLNYNKERNLPAFRNGIDESQYCAYDPIGTKDSCQGDSGGPLQTVRTYSNPTKVVGVVSFGVACGIRLPGLYTRVAYYIDWIGSYAWPNGQIEPLKINSHDNDNNEDDFKYIFSSK